MEKTVGRRMDQRHRRQKAGLGPGERKRLMQLGACIALFFVVFAAKGADRLERFRDSLTQALQADMDVQTVFADLGRSIASGQPAGETIQELWTGALFPREKTPPDARRDGPLYQWLQKDLGQAEQAQALAIHGVTLEEAQADPMAASGVRVEAEPEPTPEPAVTYVDYSGPALPDNTTMDRYALGLKETVSPVMAVQSSGFGWREHPISGGEKFHYGVDLAADSGTAVGAFADGVVDYIGESDVYGRYLQLRHQNGVTSFYAHCSKLCVEQGQTVSAGEKVAESGATGDVTGPHLHFELKLNGVRLNPAYYIQTLS